MKNTKPKDITRWERIFALSILILFILFLCWGTLSMESRDSKESVFIEQSEVDCRKANWYLEKDWYGGRFPDLKQVFCRDSSGEKLLFKKPMKYD